jgi:hypothetical protein
VRTLIIPDLHGKTIWRKAVQEIEHDRVVFLGDYVDDFIVSDEAIFSNLIDVVNYKKEHPGTVILLWGNHDLQYRYIGDQEFSCSGYRKFMSEGLHSFFFDNHNLFQAATSVDKFIVTHAGVTSYWFEEMYEQYGVLADNANIINEIFNTALKSFAIVGKARGGFGHLAGSPIWADASEEFKLFAQITGHNKFNMVKIFGSKYKENSSKVKYTHRDQELIFTDCLDMKSQFLVVEDNKLIIHDLFKGEENG